VLTIPYSTTEERQPIANAINRCSAARPDLKFLLANTDTALNFGVKFLSGRLKPSWDGYVGSANYDQGGVCGRIALSDDLDAAVRDRVDAGATPTKPVEIYWQPEELSNYGIEQRKKGIVDAIGDRGVVSVTSDPSTVSSSNYVIALGVGAAANLTKAGVGVDLQCGDDQAHARTHAAAALFAGCAPTHRG